MTKTIQLYRSPLALGICADIDPNSNTAMKLLLKLEPTLTACSMPDCGDVVVRVAVFESVRPGGGGTPCSEFRGLCERHKEFGMWGGYGND